MESRDGVPRKSFEQVVQGRGRCIAGVAVNEEGRPVAGVPVGTKDLKVTLPEGGTVIGRVFCMKGKTKMPIKGTLRDMVFIQQTDRNSLTYLDDGDRTTTPDAEGRFRFEHLSTRMRGDTWKPGLVPRLWFIEYGDASKTVAFEDGNMIADVELVLLPKPSEIPPLMGSPLPGFDGIRIDWPEDQAIDQPILVCFFDMQYQLSRNTMLGLSLKAAALQEKGVYMVGIQASGTDPNELDGWLRKIRVDFPVGTIESQDAEVRYTWGVKTLPWLILADKDHVVRAEGFAISELESLNRDKMDK